jgi:hypothetical protein
MFVIAFSLIRIGTYEKSSTEFNTFSASRLNHRGAGGDGGIGIAL